MPLTLLLSTFRKSTGTPRGVAELSARRPTVRGVSTTSFSIAVQGTFDELGTPLRQVTFVVVDLETTGGAPGSSGITEIGAVKVRGGEVLGELQTLVNPGEPIPSFIAVLTGITDRMVATAPRIDTVLPAFLEFARDCVLVAHNAPFDLGFLKAACTGLDVPWPGFDSVDTARLARRVLTSDEAPNCKLSTLARVLRASVQPTHRALDDARATVDVLHVLFERLGGLGIISLDELRTFTGQVTRAAAQQTPSRRRDAALPRRLRISATNAVGFSTSARPRICAAGCAITSRRLRCGSASSRWWRSHTTSCRSCARPSSRRRCASSD